mgnify:CR=1 FL=1
MEIDPFIFRLSIFILSIFIGYYVVWSVTPSLHTPLMSGANAIHGVVIIGAILVMLRAEPDNILAPDLSLYLTEELNRHFKVITRGPKFYEIDDEKQMSLF